MNIVGFPGFLNSRTHAKSPVSLPVVGKFENVLEICTELEFSSKKSAALIVVSTPVAGSTNIKPSFKIEVLLSKFVIARGAAGFVVMVVGCVSKPPNFNFPSAESTKRPFSTSKLEAFTMFIQPEPLPVPL